MPAFSLITRPRVRDIPSVSRSSFTVARCGLPAPPLRCFLSAFTYVVEAGFKCVEALGRIVIRGQSGGVPVWLSVWSKVQTTS